ncbi:MAG: 50S ribosomal protein L15 [Planctomycetota bacterium]|jgi:large subunit ribosomal protein L15
MNLTDLNEKSGRYKARKRVGRGTGAGNGKTSGRGQKGQKSRSGYSRTFSFEGGQIPLFRKLPKRGFNNVFRTLYDVVNVSDLNRLEDGASVNLETLVAEGMIKNPHGKLKILGNGKLEKKLTVEAAKFTATARQQIEALGGEAKEV